MIVMAFEKKEVEKNVSENDIGLAIEMFVILDTTES